MTFYAINALYFMSWFFIVMIYILSLNIDRKTHYNHARTIRIKCFWFLFKYNKQNPTRIAVKTFVVQLISIILMILSLFLLLLSLFLAETNASIVAWIFTIVVFAVFVAIAIFYGVRYRNISEVQLSAKDDPEYLNPEKTSFGRNELNVKSTEEKNEKDWEQQ